MDVISLSAIKKAKKEIVDLLNKIDGQTLQSMVLELRNTLSKLDREKLSAADFNQMMASIQEHLASKLDASISSRLSKADFDSWKAPWTPTRVAKLDRLDATVSSRADGKDWTAERAGKVDKLDVAVSSRADGALWTPSRAAKVDSLDTTVSSRADGSYYTPARAVKLDSLDANITTRASQTSLDSLRGDVRALSDRGTIKRVQRGEIQHETSGWEDAKDNTGVSDSGTYTKTITLPYSVNVEKSKESCTVWNKSTGGDDNIGVTCILISSNKLLFRMHSSGIWKLFNSHSGICWTVEEWY